MLLKIFFIPCIIHTLEFVSEANPLSENNERDKLDEHIIKGTAVKTIRESTTDRPMKPDIESLKVDLQSLTTNNRLLRADFKQEPELKLVSEIQSLPGDLQSGVGKWTTILKRFDGTVNFYRNWTDYKNGFGNPRGEFFLGLEKIHEITSASRHELLVILKDFDEDERFEFYDDFEIGDEDQQYKLLSLGESSGTAGDALEYHRGMKFSTFDYDNDEDSINCAEKNNGAWWYKGCHRSQLTGQYGKSNKSKGIYWHHFRGDGVFIKRAELKIRPIK